jgi:hypothetical protein
MANKPKEEKPKSDKVDKKALEQSVKSHEKAIKNNQTVRK